MPVVTTFTRDLTNSDSPFVIDENDGITRLSIFNSSATAVSGTVTGTKSLNNGSTQVASGAISIAQNVTFTILAGNQGALGGLTIVIPASCTLSVVAS